MLFLNHKYELLHQGDSEYHIALFREQRLHRFDSMKQPVPAGALMGLDLVLHVKYMGKPASNHWISIFRDKALIYSGRLNEKGHLYGIPLPWDHKCKCVPIGLSNMKEDCSELVDQYCLEIKPPEAFPLALSASEDLNPIATI